MAVTKIGNTLLLDRDYGKPIFDAKFKIAPTSDIPGEKTAAYQPSFNLPEMFMDSTFTIKDVTNISEIQKQNILLKKPREFSRLFCVLLDFNCSLFTA